MLAAEPQFGGGKQPIDNQHILIRSVIDDFRFAVLAQDKQWWQFTLDDPWRELDVNLAPIVISIDGTPGRAISLDGVAVSTLSRIGSSWRRR